MLYNCTFVDHVTVKVAPENAKIVSMTSKFPKKRFLLNILEGYFDYHSATIQNLSNDSVSYLTTLSLLAPKKMKNLQKI